jgi:hypothetical protein
VTTDQRVVAKQEIQEVESAKRAGERHKHEAAAATFECAPSETMPRQEALKGRNGVHRFGAEVRKNIEPNVPTAQRLRKFPDAGFELAGNELSCPAFKKMLANIKSSITSHLGSLKHAGNIVKWAERNSGGNAVKVFLQEYYLAHADEEKADVRLEVKHGRF